MRSLIEAPVNNPLIIFTVTWSLFSACQTLDKCHCSSEFTLTRDSVTECCVATLAFLIFQLVSRHSVKMSIYASNMHLLSMSKLPKFFNQSAKCRRTASCYTNNKRNCERWVLHIWADHLR